MNEIQQNSKKFKQNFQKSQKNSQNFQKIQKVLQFSTFNPNFHFFTTNNETELLENHFLI